MSHNERIPATAIGQRIRNRRKAKNKTLNETAFEAGINPSVYCRIELGDRDVRFDELERIAAALSCDVRQLVPPRAA